MEWIVAWIARHGYAAVFSLLVLGIIGVPVPDEVLLMYVGHLVSKGHMALAPAIAVAGLGSLCGISVSYLIGRYVGLAVILRWRRFFRVTDRGLARVQDWFVRWGKWTLVIGYFVPGVRHLTAIVAGTSRMPYPQFALFAYSGAMVWATTFILLGDYLGAEAMKVVPAVHQYLSVLAATVVAAGVAFLLVRHFRKRRSA